jgi:hypothetical protein
MGKGRRGGLSLGEIETGGGEVVGMELEMEKE